MIGVSRGNKKVVVLLLSEGVDCLKKIKRGRSWGDKMLLKVVVEG